tara:strand:- start:402 stop:617 length:216 start_codon:yes stop_codon:yes gene_type:complete
MVDHSRSNRIIQAAHERGDIKPVPVLGQRLSNRLVLHVIRARLRADKDLSFIADLPDQTLEILRQAVLGDD